MPLLDIILVNSLGTCPHFRFMSNTYMMFYKTLYFTRSMLWAHVCALGKCRKLLGESCRVFGYFLGWSQNRLWLSLFLLPKIQVCIPTASGCSTSESTPFPLVLYTTNLEHRLPTRCQSSTQKVKWVQLCSFKHFVIWEVTFNYLKCSVHTKSVISEQSFSELKDTGTFITFG